MKTSLLSIICLLTLSASKCKKEGVDCHYNIFIKNNSTNKVVWGIVSNGIAGCRIDGKELEKAATAEYRPYNLCLENSLSNGQAEHIYIIDPSLYNASNVFYSCDSIEHYNKILMHYVLTFSDLEKINFTIEYK
jgi:hypothetical protein